MLGLSLDYPVTVTSMCLRVKVKELVWSTSWGPAGNVSQLGLLDVLCTSTFRTLEYLLLGIFANSGIFISLVTLFSLNWKERTENCISCIEWDIKIEINIWLNFEVRSLFLRTLSRNILVLTHVVKSLAQNWIKKDQNLYFVYQWW